MPKVVQKRLDEGRAVYDLEHDGEEENVVGAHRTPGALEGGPGLPEPVRLPQSVDHDPLDDVTPDSMDTYLDDVSGEVLPPTLTHEARVEEIKFMQGRHVWDVVPIAECKAVTGRAPIRGPVG